MTSDSFRIAAENAIGEGSRARKAAAEQLASQFAAGAEHFDPRALERLGEEGLAAFLSGLGSRNPLPNWHQSEPVTDHSSFSNATSATTLGWANCRQSEPRWLIEALMIAYFAGLAVAAIGSLIIKFLE